VTPSIDPAVHHGKQQIFFGATVTYLEADGARHTLTILGIAKVDSSQAQVSWVSPIARTLLKAHSGDVVQLLTPAGKVEIEVVDVQYPAPGMNTTKTGPAYLEAGGLRERLR
jgi:transcription elongation factor GreB